MAYVLRMTQSVNDGSLFSWSALFTAVLRCMFRPMMILLPAALLLIPIRFLTKVPSFIFRKLLHIVAFSCVTMMVLTAENWYTAALTFILIEVITWPILFVTEKMSWFPKLLAEKEPGEIRRSLLMFFLMLATLTAVCWGIFKQREIVAEAILMWGTGDAAAALIGIPFGKHKIRLKGVDEKKSWEGSLSMFTVSFLCGVIVMTVFHVSLSKTLISAAVGAVFGTAAELFTPRGIDNVTIPAAIAAVLLLLSRL